jgi:hypothetical protein
LFLCNRSVADRHPGDNGNDATPQRQPSWLPVNAASCCVISSRRRCTRWPDSNLGLSPRPEQTREEEKRVLFVPGILVTKPQWHFFLLKPFDVDDQEQGEK